METIILNIKNLSDSTRKNEPVSVGIPLPKGQIHNVEQLTLKDEYDPAPSQFTPLCNWPDGTVKWVLMDSQLSAKASTDANYYIETLESHQEEKEQGIHVEENENSFLINTGNAIFSLNKQRLFPFVKITENKNNTQTLQSSEIILTGKNDVKYSPVIEHSCVETSGPLKTTLKVEGAFFNGESVYLNFICRLHFFHRKAQSRIDFTLWNKNPSKHSGGLWDLGDPGSVLFKDLSFKFVLSPEIAPEKQIRVNSHHDVRKMNSNSVSIYQDSSGGENWYCTNHINCEQEIPLKFKGYKVYEDDVVIEDGLRSTPIVYIGDGQKGISATVHKFWQNFPKGISAKQNEISIQLFPGQFADLHELQGGERKTHSIYVDFSGNPEALSFVEQPLQCILPREWYSKTEAIAYLAKEDSLAEQPYNNLLETALSGEHSFFAGREKIDEYGWRNFGEIYADHEAVGHNGAGPLISHYNNQYDQIFGFFREFIASGNASWHHLMDDLANHVRDIDIYYTDADRLEYNNGLHWHTNHYLDAATCTHRSFSKGHLEKYDPQFYGGGPGMEHCYVSGLLYHYYTTGEEASRDAVLAMAGWICNAVSYSETILGMANDLKNLFPQWRQTLSGNKVRADRFAFTRGSGNPISSLLDAYSISKDELYLKKAEEIIKGCIHPEDDIESRDLLNAELAWSYNVCLQAIGKYLDVKISIEEYDYMYSYAQEALVHYAKWMLENEYPYLEKAESLEFPNETWPAQDLRKSCVFYFAAKHSSGDFKSRFITKAEYYHNYSIQKLSEFETKSLARPIALLMQNRWMHAYFCEHPETEAPSFQGKYDFSRKDEFWTPVSIIKSGACRLKHSLTKFTIAKEKQWLRCRKGTHI